MSRARIQIPIARPWFTEGEVRAVGRVIKSGWVTQGPEVAAFEHEFAAYVGARYACAVSSCTTALHLALLGVGVKPGDEVITVSHSFIATANSVRYCGAMPVFVDVEPTTFNMDPSLIERVVTERTRAILCVHQMGLPCDMKKILAVARRHSLAVVEDAACAMGSEIRWRGRWERIGKPHGDVACFSFHPRKVVSTGDGGMVTTSNPDLDRTFRLWRQHGMSVPDILRHQTSRVIFESYEKLGFNYRMTDIQAAIGREQIKKLAKIVEKRRALGQKYETLLRGIRGLGLPAEPPWAKSNRQTFCVRLPENAIQKQIMKRLLERGIATRRGIMCAHREPAYAVGGWACGRGPGSCGCARGTCARLTESERAQDQGLAIPLFPQMKVSDVNRVAACLKDALAESGKDK